MTAGADFDALMRAFAANPDGYETNRDLGLGMIGTNSLVLGAERHILKALSFEREGSDRERLLHGLAMVAEYKGDYDTTIALLTQLFNRQPGSLNYLPELGDAFFNAGRMEEAGNVYRIVLGLCHERAVKDAFGKRGPVTQLIFPFKVICTRFGEMAEKLDIHVKARALGLTPDVQAVLLAPPDLIVNGCLMDYWRRSIRRYVTVVSDSKEIAELERTYIANPLFVDCMAVPDGRIMNRLAAYLFIQRQWEAEGRAPLLHLTEDHRRRGRQTLARLGMPEDAWFAGLHVRGSGFHGEVEAWDHNALRNANIDDYRPAMEAIAARGGWVVRMGDASMMPLPSMPGVIDYVHTDAPCDWMDVFVCGESRFFIGTTSGPASVAFAFGVPVIGTNWFPMGYCPYSTRDIVIHKLFRRRSDKRFLSIRDSVRPPLPGMHWPLYFKANDLEVVDNSPEDITGAVFEMMDRLDGTLSYSAEDEEAQNRYAAACDFGGFEPNARAARDFLRRHPFLIDGAVAPHE